MKPNIYEIDTEKEAVFLNDLLLVDLFFTINSEEDWNITEEEDEEDWKQATKMLQSIDIDEEDFDVEETVCEQGMKSFTKSYTKGFRYSRIREN